MQILFAADTSSGSSVFVGIGGFILLIVWVGWGLMPSRKAKQISAAEKATAERAYETGVVVGMLGGDIEDAAVARYAQSRREADGHQTTSQDVIISAAVSTNAGD